MIYWLILLASCNVLNGKVLTCDQPKDIVFILDSSESISNVDFNHAKNSIIKTISPLKISSIHTRIAFVQFGSSTVLKFNLDTFSNNKRSMIKTIKAAKHTHGLTAIGKSLNMTLYDIVPKMRRDVIKIVILSTDGTNNMYPAPLLYADKIKNEDVRLICIGIGSDINHVELTLIASEGSAIIVKTFQDIEEQMIRVLEHTCQLPDPIPFKPCSVQKQDLVFLVDSSSSLTVEDFINSKELVKKIIENSPLGNNSTRVAMISFCEDVRLDFDLDTYSTKEEYLSAIDGTAKFGSLTAIGLALDKALNTLLPKRRASIPFNIVLITDGVNNVFPRPSFPAEALKKEGANIICVGVGSSVDYEDLRRISSNNRVITISNYAELVSNLLSVERIITCG